MCVNSCVLDTVNNLLLFGVNGFIIKDLHSMLQKGVPLKIQVLADGFLADKIPSQLA